MEVEGAGKAVEDQGCESPQRTFIRGRALPQELRTSQAWLKQIKQPRLGREKPWYQDHACFNLPLKERAVAIWPALEPATIENGCMHILDIGETHQPHLHWSQRSWQTCDSEIQGPPFLVVPLPSGGALVFDSLLPHGAPKNHSAMERWVLQFPYLPDNAANWTAEQRMELFGTEGKDVTC